MGEGGKKSHLGCEVGGENAEATSSGKQMDWRQKSGSSENLGTSRHPGSLHPKCYSLSPRVPEVSGLSYLGSEIEMETVIKKGRALQRMD